MALQTQTKNNSNEDTRAILLLVDTSGSMSGLPLRKLQLALNSLKHSVGLADSDICVLGFNDHVYVIQDWICLRDMKEVSLSAYGGSSIETGFKAAIDSVKSYCAAENKTEECRNKTKLIIVSDGYCSDCKKIRSLVSDNSNLLDLYFIGVPGYDRETGLAFTDDSHLVELEGNEELSDVINAICFSNDEGQKDISNSAA